MTSSQVSTGKSRKLHLDLDKEIRTLSSKDSENLDLELKSMQSQLSSLDLQSSMRTSGFLHRKNSSMIEDLLKSVHKTEKQITSMEKTIKKAKKVHSNHLNSPQLLQELQSQLIQERQTNYSLQKENEKLRKKMQYKKNFLYDLNSLQEDYQTLIDSFHRSEGIRKKQKEMIRNLKLKLVADDRYN